MAALEAIDQQGRDLVPYLVGGLVINADVGQHLGPTLGQAHIQQYTGAISRVGQAESHKFRLGRLARDPRA